MAASSQSHSVPPVAGVAPPELKLLSRSVADWVASRIIAGELAPGERLHEKRIAAEAGVSRSPVREALRLLAREGLVEVVPRAGARVARVSARDAADLYAARLLIEPRCVGFAVESMTAADAQELDSIHHRMELTVDAEDPREFLEHNTAYYRRLLALCPNAVLRELVELSWTKSLRYWSVLIRLPNYVAASVRRNRVLNDAVQARDPAAAEVAVSDVLRQALEQMRVSLEHAHERSARAKSPEAGRPQEEQGEPGSEQRG